MDAIHTEEYKGHTIKIIPDDTFCNPRKDWDNYTTMVCFHGRYNLGDDGHGLTSDMFDGWAELKAHIESNNDVIEMAPLYLYDHSGISIKIGSWIGHAPHASWDSGMVGFIYVTKQQLKEVGTIDAKKLLEGDVECYDQYLRGNVYGYQVVDPDGEDGDSCWGFFGDYEEEGGCLSEARSVIDYIVEEELKRTGEQQELSI